jgi:transcriptional regulator with XRE-family HTH domain|nr:MAG TPA: Helix-turn-helix XRE-family like protein [Caudoviricetes sp.]
MKTYYKNKRNKVGLSQSDMARELGIPCVKYEQIERGEIKMPKKLIDKFNEIITRGNNIHSLEKLEHEREVNEYIDWLIKDDHLKLEMNMFNISTRNELGQLLGYKDGTILSKLFSGKYANGYCYDLKNKIYLFFHDELNMQPKKLNKQISNKQKSITIKLKKYCETYGLTQSELSKQMCISLPTINRLLKETQIVGNSTLNKIDTFLKSKGFNKDSVDSTADEKFVPDVMFLGPTPNEDTDILFPELPSDDSNITVVDFDLNSSKKTTDVTIPDETDSKELYSIKKIYNENHEKIQKLTEEINKLVQREGVLLDILKEIERL